jgi:hypothetical protein
MKRRVEEGWSRSIEDYERLGRPRKKLDLPEEA